MNAFSESQTQDLRDLQTIAEKFGTDVVIIGAMAYRFFIDDVSRETYDVDLAVALDIHDFKRFETALASLGWQHSDLHEQRWSTPRGNRLDLVPAGASLRREGRLAWPRSGFVMSLAGFDHVFQDAVISDLGGGLRYKVVPPPVLALLKMASYLDDPHRRSKDLTDFHRLLGQYQKETDRIFADEVFDAQLPDIEFASGFLLGLDVGSMAASTDVSLVETFLLRMKQVHDEPIRSVSADDDWSTREAANFQQHLAAFAKGFRMRQKG
jgi:predicted nucleotidyltransferase